MCGEKSKYQENLVITFLLSPPLSHCAPIMERAVRCEEEDNDDFISTEHVSLTKELQQEKSAATQELGEIVKELEIEEGSYDRSDLLSVIKHLHRTLKNYKLKPLNSDLAEDDFSADLLDVANITDEKLKFEVIH